jgi:acetylornithine deacetylase/succinyl-diaminopimelate desuccinylase-like protein
MIPGFYDDVVPLSDREQQAIAAIPSLESSLMAELGIAKPDGDGARFAELMTRPTLNINGIRSANVGAATTNIIPSTAEAVLDLRLVKGNTLTRQVAKVVEYIRAQGYHVMDHEPSDEERRRYDKLIRIDVGSGYDAQRTSMDLPIAQDIIAAVQSTSRQPVVAVPSAGGSLPLALFEKELGANAIFSVPVVNYDNNQHTANENVQVGFLWEGIEMMAAIMSIN